MDKNDGFIALDKKEEYAHVLTIEKDGGERRTIVCDTVGEAVGEIIDEESDGLLGEDDAKTAETIRRDIGLYNQYDNGKGARYGIVRAVKRKTVRKTTVGIRESVARGYDGLLKRIREDRAHGKAINMADYGLFPNKTYVLTTVFYNDGWWADVKLVTTDGDAWTEVEWHDNRNLRVGDSSIVHAGRTEGTYTLTDENGDTVRQLKVVRVADRAK